MFKSYDFESSIGYWMSQAHQAYNRALNKQLEPYGITYRQSHVIWWLSTHGPMCQTDLAAYMMIEPPTLVRILDRMEQAGLLERAESPGDRRKKIIRLLAAAEPAWAKIADSLVELRRKAVEGIPQEEVDQLMNTLKKVLGNVQTLAPQDAVMVADT